MKPKAFVLMPFDEGLKEIYECFIKSALSEAGFDVTKADDIVSQQNILRDIISSILDSNLIIADLTGANPNVYYELGLAHASNKDVILLTQDITELPFDLKSYRVIEYNTHFAKISEAREQLINLLKRSQEGNVPFGNPYTDFTQLSDSVVHFELEEKDSIHEGGGFLDHIINVEEGFNDLTQIVERVNEGLKQVTENSTKLTEEISEAAQNRGTGTAKHMRKILKSGGELLKDIASELSSLNSQYQDKLSDIGINLELAISSDIVASSENQGDLIEFLSSLETTELGASEAVEPFDVLFSLIERLPNVEKTYNQAKNMYATELGNYRENMLNTAAIISRSRAIGNRVLEGIRTSPEPAPTEKPKTVTPLLDSGGEPR